MFLGENNPTPAVVYAPQSGAKANTVQHGGLVHTLFNGTELGSRISPRCPGPAMTQRVRGRQANQGIFPEVASAPPQT